MRKFPRKGFLMNLVGTETNVFFHTILETVT